VRADSEKTLATDSSVIAAVEPAPVPRRVLYTFADVPLNAGRLVVSQIASTPRQEHQRQPSERSFDDREHACDPRFIPMLGAELDLLEISGSTADTFFIWTAAFGIKSAIRRIDSFQALRSRRDRSSNGEIVRLALDHQRISAGWKHEFLLL